MINILIPYLTALVVTPMVIRLAWAGGFVDKADDNALKIHIQPVALLGGVPIVVVFLLGLVFFGWALFVAWNLILRKIIAAGLLVFGVGLWDDIKGVKPILRIIIQIFAGLMVLSTGLRINIVAISWIVAPLTLF